MDKILAPIKQRILEIVDIKGIHKEIFFKNIGVSASNFRSKSLYSEVGGEVIAKISSVFPEINTQWLITGHGEMFLGNKGSDNKVSDDSMQEPTIEYNRTRVNLFDKSPAVDVQEIPLYDLEATAGILSLFNDTHSNPVDTIRIPGVPKCDGAIPITGDSMYPLLKSGDIVLYKQVNDPLNCTYFWGEMYIVGLLQDGETFVMVKYIQRSELGAEYIKLVSQNQHHNPIDVLKININALALVRASVRINAMQ